MKKLSLMIALGSFVFLSIAKPAINATAFETYSKQMQAMTAQYMQEKKFDVAGKAIAKWIETYEALADKEKAAHRTTYAAAMYQQACSYAQTNEMFKALKSLKEAVKNGYGNKNEALNDPNLAPLKSYSEFNKIIDSIKG